MLRQNVSITILQFKLNQKFYCSVVYFVGCKRAFVFSGTAWFSWFYNKRETLERSIWIVVKKSLTCDDYVFSTVVISNRYGKDFARFADWTDLSVSVCGTATEYDCAAIIIYVVLTGTTIIIITAAGANVSPRKLSITTPKTRYACDGTAAYGYGLTCHPSPGTGRTYGVCANSGAIVSTCFRHDGETCPASRDTPYRRLPDTSSAVGVGCDRTAARLTSRVSARPDVARQRPLRPTAMTTNACLIPSLRSSAVTT